MPEPEADPYNELTQDEVMFYDTDVAGSCTTLPI